MTATRPRDLRDLGGGHGAKRRWLPYVDAEGRDDAEVRDAIAAALARRPKPAALRVHRLGQAAFESLIDAHGRELRAIDFWKCPRIADLTPLEHAPRLELVDWYWNQRAERLWKTAVFRSLAPLAGLDGLRRLRSTRRRSRTTASNRWPDWRAWKCSTSSRASSRPSKSPGCARGCRTRCAGARSGRCCEVP